MATRLQMFEQFVVDVIYEKRKSGLRVRLFKVFLKTLSIIFTGLVKIRYHLYNNGILKSRPLGCLVVVVGNLTVGGTGKTPVVEKFAKSLTERGRKVAILSRGYKSKPDPMYKRFFRWITHGEAPPPKVVSDGASILMDSEDAGDEPYMLARNLPGVVVLVDKNRVKAGSYAIKHFGCDTLLLDDGFQYLHLKGRLNLLLIDKTNPFGNGNLLPRGILREPIKHIKRSSYIFITKSDGQPCDELKAIIHEHKPEAEIIECTHKPQYIQALGSQCKEPLEALKSKHIAVLSGIASPESFERYLLDQGAIICHKERFLDHHRFTELELERFIKKATEQKAQWILTTEKDAVRIPQKLAKDIPIYFLRMEIAILKGANDFEQAVSKICFPTYDRLKKPWYAQLH